MKLKFTIINCITAAIVCAFPLCSFAGDGFYISNDSPYDASFKVNKGDCSTTSVGVAGLVQKKTLSGINYDITASLCGKATTNCSFEVYMTKDCTGPSVATVTFDLNKGIVSLDVKKANGFFVSKQSEKTLYIAGGPLPK